MNSVLNEVVLRNRVFGKNSVSSVRILNLLPIFSVIQVKSQVWVNIDLPALSVKPNEPIFLPIQIKQDANVVSACELTLNYEAGILTPTKVMTTDATKEYTLEYQIKDKKINISLAGAEAIAQSGVLVQVEFEPFTSFEGKPQSQPMVTRLNLENVRLNGKTFWNGKNQNGECVANGLYFYTLKAGEFQATRKMTLVK